MQAERRSMGCSENPVGQRVGYMLEGVGIGLVEVGH